MDSLGATNFETIKNNLNSQNTGAVFAMVFVIVGLAFKVSAVPFHMWTPDVYEGSPTSIIKFFCNCSEKNCRDSSYN